MAPERVLGIER